MADFITKAQYAELEDLNEFLRTKEISVVESGFDASKLAGVVLTGIQEMRLREEWT